MIGCVLYFFLFSFILILGAGFGAYPGVSSLEFGSFFFVDSVSFYLMFLSFFLGSSLLFFSVKINSVTRAMIVLSVGFSLLSYCCVNSLGFWVFYEMSILPLLYLLIMESPYSERYVASWYLLGYVFFTSLPMVMCLFYLSSVFGSHNLLLWGSCGEYWLGVYLVLALIFVTKVPLPPFHTWLPIVHAEASSPVSVCLSGYIMKLGLLGICRFCSFISPGWFFSNVYLVVCFLMGILFFCSSCMELDGKRWLAFLSLSHILIACLCLSVCGFDGVSISFLFSLGHGFSAGVSFLILWLMYELTGSRNWLILSQGLSGGFYLRFLYCAGLCTVASLPPTVQFYSEVLVLSDAWVTSGIFIFVLAFYLFFGGLVPLVVIGFSLTRPYSISFSGSAVFSCWVGVIFLVAWGYILFLVV